MFCQHKRWQQTVTNSNKQQQQQQGEQQQLEAKVWPGWDSIVALWAASRARTERWRDQREMGPGLRGVRIPCSSGPLGVQ